jgi:hypothetical protein
MKPGSEDAVHMGCTCKQEKTDNPEDKKIVIDPYCPYHWHIAVQANIRDLVDKARKTENFNSALKVGYFILALGLAIIFLIKS